MLAEESVAGEGRPEGRAVRRERLLGHLRVRRHGRDVQELRDHWLSLGRSEADSEHVPVSQRVFEALLRVNEVTIKSWWLVLRWVIRSGLSLRHLCRWVRIGRKRSTEITWESGGPELSHRGWEKAHLLFPMGSLGIVSFVLLGEAVELYRLVLRAMTLANTVRVLQIFAEGGSEVGLFRRRRGLQLALEAEIFL